MNIKRKIDVRGREGKIVSDTIGLVGFRGTKTEIEEKLQTIVDNEDIKVRLVKFDTDTTVDIGYVTSLGKAGEKCLEFDIFVIKTREKRNGKRVLYITQITFLQGQ